jgi:DNA-binding CsgD family transcriptional regulator/tetratricopeptide (TPR) repeat protein
MASGVSEGLFERDEEVERLARVLDAAAAGAGSLVVIAAPAGLGKTQLLRAAIDDSSSVGARALVARASELEADFAFGIVRQLFEPVVSEADDALRAKLLSGAAAHAASVLDLEPAGDSDPDRHTTIHGLYWLLANLSAETPLLVAIDDMQWADESSLRWLAYTVRRLERLPIAVVLTVRTNEDGTVALDDQTTAGKRDSIGVVLTQERTLRLEPGPLHAGAVAAMIEGALGEPGEERFVGACLRHTGGNPFLLSEVVAELADEKLAPVESNAARLEGVVPDRVGETIRRHLARLGPDATELAGAVAVLGDSGDLSIAAELSALDLDTATTAATELSRSQILDDSRELRFRHPLLRSAVEARIPVLELGRQHGRAARLLAATGAPPGRVAAHLLRSVGTGDPTAVEQLRAAARAARAQGVPEQAAALLRRALAEPPQAEVRTPLLSELGMAALRALEPDATEHLEAALERTSDPAERAELVWHLGMGYLNARNHQRAVDLLAGMIEEIRDVAELHEEWLRLEAALAQVGRYDLTTEEQVRGRLNQIAESLAGETPAERAVIAMAGAERPGPSADEHYRAVARENEALQELGWPDVNAETGTVVMYLLAHRPDAATDLADRMLAEAVAEASPSHNAAGLVARGATALELGNLAAAEADLLRADELIQDLRLGAYPGHVGLIVRTFAWLGKHREADDLLRREGLDGPVPEVVYANMLLFGRGVLRLLQARWSEARADLLELGRRHEIWGFSRPTPPWRSTASEVLLALGEHDAARKLAADELALARAWDTPKAIATATRSLALAEGGEAAIDGLTQAVELLEGTPWLLDRARAHCDLGAALRRAGRRRDGREQLARGLDEAHACGAEPLAERAANELRASGARPRRRALSGLDSLTPSEHRVAVMAASGKTNRVIAQELFVTLATVETHLTRAYRKLEISGRDGLPAALDEQAD